jgi:hypothetical protein
MHALVGKEVVVVGVGPGGVLLRLGEAAAAGYARYLNTSPGAFVAGIKGAPTPEDVAGVVVDFASGRKTGAEAYLAKADGMEALT